jgi:hypothetical protein
MIEGSVEGVTGLLEGIADWGGVAGKELGEAFGNPSNVPIFLSSLVKFSLGPFLAFGLSFLAFRWQEKRKDQKVSESTRAMIILENLYNLNEMRKMEEKLSRIEGEIDLPLNVKPEIFLEFFKKSLLDLGDFAEKEQIRSSFFSKVDPSLLTQSFDANELLLIYDLYNNVYPNLVESIRKTVKRCDSGMVLDDIQDLEKVISEIEETDETLERNERELESFKAELEKLQEEQDRSSEAVEESRTSFRELIKTMCETLEIHLRNDHDIDLILDLMVKLFDGEEELSGRGVTDRIVGLMLRLRDGEIDLSELERRHSNKGESVDWEPDYQKLQKAVSDLKALKLQRAEIIQGSLTFSVRKWIIQDISKEIIQTGNWASRICKIPHWCRKVLRAKYR